ncbi:amidohydrolase family protein [soil metagenome]
MPELSYSRIDAHQHFWNFDPVRDSWINNDMQVIRRDFSPADLKPILDKHHMEGCVAVQADQSELENELLLKYAADNDFIKGVVGWVDLRADDIDQRLQYYKQSPKLKGFRHVLQGETDRALMLNPVFMAGIDALSAYDYTYDILIYPDQLGYTLQFVREFPNQRFVIDHIGKPDIKNNLIESWAKKIRAVSACENVWCKVSGMVTEADWLNWSSDDFKPYLDVVFNAFGVNRLMFGSDWPVCNVAGGYDKMLMLIKNYTLSLSADEQARFWGLNAIEFYKLK